MKLEPETVSTYVHVAFAELHAFVDATRRQVDADVRSLVGGEAAPDPEGFRAWLEGADTSDAALVLHVVEELFQHLGHMQLTVDALTATLSRRCGVASPRRREDRAGRVVPGPAASGSDGLRERLGRVLVVEPAAGGADAGLVGIGGELAAAVGQDERGFEVVAQCGHGRLPGITSV